MAKINIVNSVIGVAVGGADEFFEWQDETNGRVENFKMWRDYYRIGAVALPAVALMTNTYAKYAEPVYQSALPLLTKSVIKTIRSATGTTMSRRAIPTRSVAVSRSPISQTKAPGFTNVPNSY